MLENLKKYQISRLHEDENNNKIYHLHFSDFLYL